MRIAIILALLAGMWSCTGKSKQVAQTETPATEQQETANADTSATEEEVAAEDQDTTKALPFESIVWTLHAFSEGGKNTPPAKDSKITASFNEGKVSGSAGCNVFNGAFSATESGGLEVSDLAATKRLCEGFMGQETHFLELMRQASAWKMDRVELRVSSGKTTLIFHNTPKGN